VPVGLGRHSSNLHPGGAVGAGPEVPEPDWMIIDESVGPTKQAHANPKSQIGRLVLGNAKRRVPS